MRILDGRSAWRLAAWIALIVLAAWGAGELFQRLTASQDLRLERAVVRSSPDWLGSFMRGATAFGSAPVVGAATVILIGIWFAGRRTLDVPLLVVVALAGAQGIEEIVKAAVGRPRPPVPRLVDASGTSFPSGHAMRAAVLFGVLALLVARLNPQRRIRRAAWGVAALGALLVAASRMVLGVHYLSDVLGGLVIGWGWLAASATSLPVATTSPE